MRENKEKFEIEKDNFIYRNFKLSLNYIKKIKNYIYFSFFLFLFFIIFGYLFPIFFEKEILDYIKELMKQTEGLNWSEMIVFIINNNIWSGFSGLFFGILLGIMPLFAIIVNGYVIGFVANKTVSISGPLILWRLFPHGIFEIPAVLISVSLGIKLGMFLISKKSRAKGILASFLFFICLIVSLLLISFLMSLVAGTRDSVVLENFYKNILNNPLIFFLFFLIVINFIIASIFISLKIYPKKERVFIIENLKSDIKNSLRTFIFVVIPLFVIAGTIEGILIFLIG